MIAEAAFMYIAIVVVVCGILAATSFYAASMGDGNVPDRLKTKKQYQGLGAVLGVMALWGVMILFG